MINCELQSIRFGCESQTQIIDSSKERFHKNAADWGSESNRKLNTWQLCLLNVIEMLCVCVCVCSHSFNVGWYLEHSNPTLDN